MSLIDRNTPIPAYFQLKAYLKQQIQDGIWQPGDKIPTEAELCERFNISRTPVRQALKELVFEGLLTRTAGRGTFVAQQTDERSGSASTILNVVVSDERWYEPLEKAVEVWNRDRLDTPIDLHFTQVPLGNLRSYLVEVVGRGKAPDISLLDSVWVAGFAERHYIQPLTDISSIWEANHQETFFTALLAANCFNDRLCSMPVTADISGLWYRRDWLDMEGLTPPATWEQLLSVGRHFQQPEVRQRYGLDQHPMALVGGRAGGETTTYQLLPFLWAAGADLIVDDQVVLDSPESQQALHFLASLVQTEKLVSPEVVHYAWDGAAQMFAQGKAALAIGGSYESFFIRAQAGWDDAAFLEKVGFGPIPAAPGKQPAVLVGGMSYVIYHQSQHPVEALGLLDLASSEEILGSFSVHTGHYPSLIKAVQNLSKAGNGFLTEAASLLDIARSRPAHPDYARVSEQFQLLVENCLTGRVSATQAVPHTAEMIAAITNLPQKRL
ncbi:MAG: extracellular solute-binding protein [Chloroflexales bacterium]|nr:extracellular solute-binding protein [Chloroflexales bacterium]